jgi:hypothetical protein
VVCLRQSHGNSVSLKTREKAEAVQKVNAMNETERQPSISLGLAKVYLTATDPKLATRTWQDVMENIITKKTDETLKRWQTAIKDKNFDCIRNLHVCGAPALCDESGVGFGAYMAENSTTLWSHHLISRSDETWQPEWSGKQGGVERCAVRSHLNLEVASLADKRAEIAP